MFILINKCQSTVLKIASNVKMRLQIQQVSTYPQNQKIAVSLKTDGYSAENCQHVPAKNEELAKSNSVRPVKHIPKDLPKWKPVQLRSIFEKINYPAYDTPQPGPGLELYRDRLEKIICPNMDFPNVEPEYLETGKKRNFRKENMKDGEQQDFYRNFPPKLKCPKRKPENHKLSFIDDPPYSLLSNYLHNIHNVPKKKPRKEEHVIHKYKNKTNEDMSSPNKREITKVKKEEATTSDNESETSSNASESNSEVSNDEFELAKDHFSNVHILEYDISDSESVNSEDDAFNVTKSKPDSFISNISKHSKVSSPAKVKNEHNTTTTTTPKTKKGSKVSSPVKVNDEHETNISSPKTKKGSKVSSPVKVNDEHETTSTTSKPKEGSKVSSPVKVNDEHETTTTNSEDDQSNVTKTKPGSCCSKKSKQSTPKKGSKVSSPVKVTNEYEATTSTPKTKKSSKVTSPVKVKYEYETTSLSEYDDTSESDLNKNANFEDDDDDEPSRIKVQLKAKTGSCYCGKSIERVTRKAKQESTVSLPANYRPNLEAITTSESHTQTNIVPENAEQNSNVNASKICAKFGSTGTIKIPIELQVSLKGSGHNISIKQGTAENHLEETKKVFVKDRNQPIKCIYQECSAWEYIETYLDELFEEPRLRPSEELVFNASCVDYYYEPYLHVGFFPTLYEYDVPEPPVVEDIRAMFANWDKQLLEEYKLRNSWDQSFFTAADEESKLDKEYAEVSKKELVKDDDTPIHWEDVCLPPKGEVKIAPAGPEPEEKHKIYYIPPPPTSKETVRKVAESSTKKKKSGGLFGCCGGNDDDDDDNDNIPEEPPRSPRLLKPVPKISLVYDQHCLENEPYARGLLNAYPHHEKSDSPCPSETEIPWNSLLLPNSFKIRPVDFIPKLTKVKTESSTSTTISTVSRPCMCNSSKGDFDVKPDVKKLSKSHTLPAKNSVTFRDNKLVTLYPPTNLPTVPSQSNTFKPEVLKQKEPIGIIKTTLSGKSRSDHGIMRTKVTLSGKDLGRVKEESQGRIKSSNIIKGSGHQTLDTKPICSSTNEVRVSSSHSAPVLSKQEKCIMPVSCPANIKVESSEQASVKLENKPSQTIKPDPVISALIACEAELKPVKQALNTVQQKLRNMNMPELDSIFSKGTQLANEFLNKAQQNRCPYANNYVPSYATTSVKPALHINYMNDRMKTYAPPISHYPATYTSNPAPSCTYMQQRPRPYVEQCQCGSVPSRTYVRPRPYVEQRQFAPAPSYGPYPGPSPSQGSSCASSMQNFSMLPNYDINDRYLEDRSPSKSALRRPDYRKKHVRYQRDRSEDWRSRDRSEPEHNCRCSSSKHSSHNRLNIKRSDDKISYTSSSSPSEDSLPTTRSSRRRDRRLVPKKNKSKNSAVVSRQSLCPFLEAMKSIMVLDKEKTVKTGSGGISYDTKLSTKKIKNMKVSMRVRTSKKSKK